MPKTVLIAGATGLLGPYITKAFASDWSVCPVSRHSEPLACDFCDPVQTKDLIERIKPDAVIHLVVLSNVDACEDDPALADQINHQSLRNIARVLPPQTHLTYVSTDQVYPDTPGPHKEGGEAPVNGYGKTKWAGEKAALAHPKSLILRTNLFGPSLTPGRASLSDFFIKVFQEKQPVSLFEDALFSPLHMTTLAGFVKQMVESGQTGTYNLGSRNGMSKADFARTLAQHLNLDSSTAKTVKSTALPNRAKRTRDLRLDVSCLEQVLGVEMPDLKDEIGKL